MPDEKDKGGRPKGSKTRAKNASELLNLLKEEYRKQGKTFTHTVADLEGLDEEAKTKITEAIKNNPDVGIEFELLPDEDEVDTYKCGNCQASLTGAVNPCPHCGAGLNW